MDADQLVSFILEKKWLAVVVLIIGYLVRLLKDESKFPVSVPPRWRPVIVVVLGQLLAVFLAVQSGVTWQTAIVTGLVVSFFTMGLYDLVVRAIFGDQVPWWIDIFALIFPPKKPDAPKLPMMLVGLLALFAVACTPLEKAIVKAGIDDIECALSKIDLPDDVIVRDCFDKLSPEEKRKALEQVHAQRAARAKLATEAHARGFDDAKTKLSCGGAK